MAADSQSLRVFFAYTAVICGVLFWSGKVTEKTLYDDYVVNLDGVVMPVADQAAAFAFYTQVLNFSKRSSSRSRDKQLLAVQLTGKRRLYLEPCKSNGSADPASREAPVPVIRVRNGFKKLHAKLIERSSQPPLEVQPGSCLGELPAARVSQIYRSSLGEQFLVSDQDKNKLIFYQPARRFL